MPVHRTRVGLHARNDVNFPEHDYSLVRRARIETLKMMSFADVSVFKRLRQENPNLEFIVRLYDDRIVRGSRPSPSLFVARMVLAMNRLKPYAVKFEIHNEPNHADGIEGWGPSDEQARSFRNWYMQVLPALKRACPWARFGFPALALNSPHRDLTWLDICQDAIQASDWLGCHCYWQYDNMLSDQWGLRFKLYHQRFPDKQIEITEFGNSTPNLPTHEMARQYVRYYKEVNWYPYLGSASAFIASSPDPNWAPFAWMKEGGEMHPVVESVANMERKAVEIPPPPAPGPSPKTTKRTFSETGKTVQGRFLEFLDKYGLDICGYPITDQFEEDGLPSQYFQRLALEQTREGKVQLKLVGTEAWTSRARIAELETRIKELGQRLYALGPAQPPVEDITESLPVHPTQRYATRPLTDIRRIVIHHTATGPNVAPKTLAEHQVRNQGRAGIIYHFIVMATGTIYQTNQLETVSDHAFNHNQGSVGICFAGDFGNAIPTSTQLESGGKLCAWLISLLWLPASAIVGLSELVPTQSPGKQWLSGQRWKDRLLEKVETALKAGGTEYTVLIAALQAQIQTLNEEITQLRQQSTPMPPAPAPELPGGPVSTPPIKDLVGSLPKHSAKQYSTRSLSDIRYLVIHHSAVPPTVTPQRIAEYHVKNRGWPGIGYHFVVDDDGAMYQSNNLETVSYHAASANPYAVGICFNGSFMTNVPPAIQLQAGAHLIAWLLQEFRLPLANVRGHKDLMSTACPGEQWLKGQEWKQMLYQEIAQVQQKASQASAA